MDLQRYPSLSGPSIPHSPTEGTEHAITMHDHHGKTWWTLRVNSRSPTPKSLPAFVEGDHITGVVDLNLQKPDHIKSITVVVSTLS